MERVDEAVIGQKKRSGGLRGKWKKRCKECGEVFVTASPAAKYCPDCRVQMERDRKTADYWGKMRDAARNGRKVGKVFVEKMRPGLSIEKQDECALYIGRFFPEGDFKSALDCGLFPDGLLVLRGRDGAWFEIKGGKMVEYAPSPNLSRGERNLEVENG